MSVSIIQIISRVRKIEINSPIFTNESAINSKWIFELNRGLLTIANKTTIDSINDSTFDFEGYTQFEFDKKGIPTLSFLQTISQSVPGRLNEILNSYLEWTSLSQNMIPEIDPNLATAYLGPAIERIYGSN